MSDSDSSLELHDVDWTEQSSIFSYDDPLIVSPQLSAVIQNNIPRLKSLLSSGKSVNINDNAGNTPLHVSVLKNKREIFDYLLKVEDIRVDVQNFEGETPLIQALKIHNEYYAFELLKNGADVTLSQNNGDTALHYAMENSVEIAAEVIKKGADVNAVNYKGKTPLHLASEQYYKHLDVLMYYGADPTIGDDENVIPFIKAVHNCPLDVLEIFFNYTFDDGCDFPLEALIVIMKKHQDLFYKLIKIPNIRLCFDDTTALNFISALSEIDNTILLDFVNRFESVAQEIFSIYDPLSFWAAEMGTTFTNIIFMFSASNLIGEIVQNFSTSGCFFLKNLSEQILTELLLILLSYGFNAKITHAFVVYEIYGYCFIFRVLLHMDIDLYDINSHYYENPVVRFMFQPFLKKEYFKTLSSLSLLQFHFICKFFLLSSDYLSLNAHNGANCDNTPSLKELAREASKRYLVNRYNIRNNRQFYTLLKWLPIQQIIKDILSYKRPIYNYCQFCRCEISSCKWPRIWP